MKKLILAICILGLLVGNTYGDDPIPNPDNGVTGDVFYGKVHVLKKVKEDKSQVVDIISFELSGTKGQDVPPFILVFNSKEREQEVIKMNEKFLWLEGSLGYSGQRNFIFCTSILVRK